jgi:formylglycine-generating enzyme required for sulfatase activity
VTGPLRVTGVVALALIAAACNYSLPRLGGDGGGGDGRRPADGAGDAQIVNLGCTSTCGPTDTSDCCASRLVPGNATGATMAGASFFRSYDVAADGMFNNMSFPATVSDFRLDTYVVTVGRFRAFVNMGMGTQSSAPAQGAGAHTQIPNSGWNASDDSNLVADTSALTAAVQCDASAQSWTDNPGANESLPMNCITWYEAFAFCFWDGGYLPTWAEWNYAASGGTEQRAYPWSNPASSVAIDCEHANYSISFGNSCVNGVNRVGSESPTGDGKFGQADLAGNVAQWTLDGFVNPYPTATCSNCADLTDVTNRSLGGGDFIGTAAAQRVADRGFNTPDFRAGEFGVRCARAP